jgi:hypothetical protein
MHVIVYWERRGTTKDNDPAILELRAGLDGYSWVRPMSGSLYVVQVASEVERTRLKDTLVDVCKKHPAAVHMLVSPAISNGSYGGWLPEDMWQKVNQRI